MLLDPILEPVRHPLVPVVASGCVLDSVSTSRGSILGKLPYPTFSCM